MESLPSQTASLRINVLTKPRIEVYPKSLTIIQQCKNVNVSRFFLSWHRFLGLIIYFLFLGFSRVVSEGYRTQYPALFRFEQRGQWHRPELQLFLAEKWTECFRFESQVFLFFSPIINSLFIDVYKPTLQIWARRWNVGTFRKNLDYRRATCKILLFWRFKSNN